MPVAQVVFALAGLVSFALVLTLVEQVILSLVQENVTTGKLGNGVAKCLFEQLRLVRIHALKP